MATFHFKGKEFIYAHHHSTPHRALDIVHKKSLPVQGQKPSLDDNLIIHGDNLHALKSLLPRYAGQVKCVYIDPPYNTGNEGWCYNDNVNSPLMRRWIKENGAVEKEDMERHDKWCCMMWPRIQLLHELLRDDGVIFISVDDNEVHHLRMMMDEIFGENNLISCLIWRKKAGGGQDSEYFAREHDYLICYRKKEDFKLYHRVIAVDNKDYRKIKNGRKCSLIRLEKWGSNALRSDRPTMHYPIKDPDGKDFFPRAPNGQEGNWRTKPGALDENHIHWERSKNEDRWIPYEVVYLDEANGEKTIKDRTIFYCLATTTDATEEQKLIFGKKYFDNSKPADLIRRLVRLSAGKDDTVLDSFAGSGTTAHAVLALNKEDGGNRKFILVECEDYADTVTAERVRRVIKGVPKAKSSDLREGLGGSFSYCQLGREINTEELLAGENMPKYDELAKYVFYTATGKTIDKVPENPRDWFVGETESYRIHLIYRQDSAFLRGEDSALNLDLAESIAKQCGGKKALVYAPCSFMAQRDLVSKGIRFCQLPWSIHRITG